MNGAGVMPVQRGHPHDRQAGPLIFTVDRESSACGRFGSGLIQLVRGVLNMDRLEELIGALSDKAVLSRSHAARHNHLCKICAKPADSFRTPFSKLEYSISSICQACQDYYFSIDE
jgi:hypothetical protein